MKPISKLQKFLEAVLDPNDPTMSVSGEMLEIIKDTLPTFEEFKGVKKINLIEMPCYMADKETEEPVPIDTSDAKTMSVESRKIAEGIPNFAEEIDLYAMSLTPILYDPEDVEEMQNSIGAFRTPMLYNPDNATPLEKITVTFSKWDMIDKLGGGESEEKEKMIKQQVMQMFEDAYDGKTGLPKRRGVIVRVSRRSHKQVEEVRV